MKLAVLFSGGKDSCAASYVAAQYGHYIACLATIESANPDSYLFHTPNITLCKLQAEAAGLPLLVERTKGEEEKEVADLKRLLERAKTEYGVAGVVTGAVESVYQATRIQRVCHELDLWVFNPFWKREQQSYVSWLVDEGFDIRVASVAAEPLNETFLGRKIDTNFLTQVDAVASQYQLSLAGEGGEYETFVLQAPGWPGRVVVDEASKEYADHAGRWKIVKAHVEKKGLPPKEFISYYEDVRPREAPLLVVSLCTEPLSEEEFVRPLARFLGPVKLRRGDEVNQRDVEESRAIILAGAPLKDDAWLEKPEFFCWLRTYPKPLLAICLGMELYALTHGARLDEALEIGMVDVKRTMEDSFIPESFSSYAMHKKCVVGGRLEALARSESCIHAFKDPEKPHYGLQFHPEARNEALLHAFTELALNKEPLKED